MKTVDYINTLIKEKENLTALCESHVETIRLIKQELNKLKSTILRKDKEILKLEEIKTPNENIQKDLDDTKNELRQLKEDYKVLLDKYNNTKTQKVSSKIKSELNKLKKDYDALQRKYDDVVRENVELKLIFDEIETLCDSD